MVVCISVLLCKMLLGSLSCCFLSSQYPSFSLRAWYSSLVILEHGEGGGEYEFFLGFYYSLDTSRMGDPQIVNEKIRRCLQR